MEYVDLLFESSGVLGWLPAGIACVFIIRCGLRIWRAGHSNLPGDGQKIVYGYQAAVGFIVIAVASIGFLPPLLLIAAAFTSLDANRVWRALPVIGGFAKAVHRLESHYRENWHLAAAAFNERGLRTLSWFTKDPTLKQWKKDGLRISDALARELLWPSIKIVALGSVLQVLAAGFERDLFLFLFSLNLYLAMIAGVATALLLPFVMVAIVEARLKLEHARPDVVRWL